MTGAFLLITMGGIMIVSALKGTSIADTLKGQLGKLDPTGGKIIPLSVPTDGVTVGGVTADTGDLLGGLGSTLAVGLGSFEGVSVAAWIIPILRYARSKGWKGHVTSGWRSAADQAKVCATGVKPCASPGTSKHQGKAYPSGAIDVTEPQQLSDILMASKWKNVLVYAGAKDPVHFSHPTNGSY